jgi:putative membrane protein insertion efficiency factor
MRGDLIRDWRRIPQRALMGFVRVYQTLISPSLGPSCRFYPTCSCYTLGALHRHGALVGSYLGVRRLLRCHPWSEPGYDPVPELAPACLRRWGLGAPQSKPASTSSSFSSSQRSL